ncbi:homoserine acetyltransferase [Phaffia rhodozyma]|uniref:Homoserine acetyltransferase n=1 Tax=Phaffia rhodozyma TaxID=264483 RepID=A0A0F7SFW7_PHARH|nr:homoserine acetyltransferase [Phaffia rhodozyma]
MRLLSSSVRVVPSQFRLLTTTSVKSFSVVRPSEASVSSRPAQGFNPSFPCVDAHEARAEKLSRNISQEPLRTSFPNRGPLEDPKGEEPSYSAPSPANYQTFHHPGPLPLTYSAPLPSFDVAYETWGTLSPKKDNVILLHTGLSASSHAASTELNPAPGWWEAFIGPGKTLDTDKFFILCCNALGGCYGSTGPASPMPGGQDGEKWATRFPVVSIFDIVRSQFHLLDHLGIDKIYASVGASMGGMQSIAAGHLFPERVGRIVSISGSARSGLTGVALRFAQRSVLMADPNWNKGFYYDGLPPHAGMKLARQIATITYRSGPEWEQRFGRRMRSQQPDKDGSNPLRVPALCPDFLIETYLDHQGEQWCLKYDANSFIYVSKAMDLFDMTASSLADLQSRRDQLDAEFPSSTPASSSTLPSDPSQTDGPQTPPLTTSYAPFLDDLAAGLKNLKDIPTLVLGVQSDILFPVDQQRDFAEALRRAGNSKVAYFELGGVWGHDTFLIDKTNVGGALRGFLA